MEDHPITSPTDDGLVCPEVGAWTEEKHRLISLYGTLFSSAMKEKWDTRVYIELYSGAGYSRIRDTPRMIFGSPLRAIQVKDPFDKYVFCEEDPDKLKALKSRVDRIAPAANVQYVPHDCNQSTKDILSTIPQYSSASRVLSLCFADPYDIGLKFSTLRELSKVYVDFVILLALWSDANRAYRRYVMEDATKVDEFLGSKTWRVRWTRAQLQAIEFPKFLAEEFAASMESLGYLRTPIHRMKRVRSDEKNLPLYYVALFSRNERAHRLWDEVLKYGTDQKSLFE